MYGARARRVLPVMFAERLSDEDFIKTHNFGLRRERPRLSERINTAHRNPACH